MLRSCWDYIRSAAAFGAWLDRLEAGGVRLINPAATVRWNMDKRYLAELERAGAPVVPTAVASPGDRLADIMAARGWAEAVLKPRVSADAHGAERVRHQHAAARQAALDALVADVGALVQRYEPAVASNGELSFVFLAGEYSHAVLKRPRAGDFRVQPQYGGSVRGHAPSRPLVHAAAALLAHVEHAWSYARVDACVVDGELVLMEIELIEPVLFLGYATTAGDRFAAEILRLAQP